MLAVHKLALVSFTVALVFKQTLQDVDMIVFPENGVVGAADSYSTTVPHPRQGCNPCLNNTQANMTQEMVRLSCAARYHRMYVVVNVPEVEMRTCNQTENVYYNTNVVFDRRGVVVARYRKYHLFLEPRFSRPEEPEISIFETDFGVRFGIFTCFDIIFQAPAVELVRKFNITDVIFPAKWFSELPFLTAVQGHAQWSHAMDANLLASGYSEPSVGSTGSGIYGGRSGALVTLMAPTNTSQLLIATVPKKKTKSQEAVEAVAVKGQGPEKNSVRAILENPSDGSLGDTPDDRERSTDLLRVHVPFSMMIEDLTAYSATPLEIDSLTDGGQQNVTSSLCHGGLCCELTVSLTNNVIGSSSESSGGDFAPPKETVNDYRYMFVVYDGVRGFSGVATAGIQICALIACGNSSKSSCGVMLTDLGSDARMKTTFHYIAVEGVFKGTDNAAQMPNTLTASYGVLAPRSFEFSRGDAARDGEVAVRLRTRLESDEILTFGIFGRDYTRDVWLGTPFNRAGTVCVSQLLALIVIPAMNNNSSNIFLNTKLEAPYQPLLRLTQSLLHGKDRGLSPSPVPVSRGRTAAQGCKGNDYYYNLTGSSREVIVSGNVRWMLTKEVIAVCAPWGKWVGHQRVPLPGSFSEETQATHLGHGRSCN
uniref:CN hydrolase domain-containing protein n=1 Tax=Timema cristinae TaxID=61476 RepID=A0A7R9HB31_TIMCR|nr:unnamed protein product [Timema cristinae]